MRICISSITAYSKKRLTMGYEFFTVSDFLADQKFKSWVLDNDADSAAFWNSWLKEHPGKREEIEEARALLYALQEKLEPVDKREIDRRVAITLDQIRSRKPSSSPLQKPVRPLLALISAACVAALVLVGWFLSGTGHDHFIFDQSEPVTGKRVVVRSSATGHEHIVLEDGSRIVLAPGSELSYPDSFDSLTREVYLKGEAFFEISRDVKRPFRVIAPDLLTEVLGTSFTVRSFESSPEASVSVRSGRVSVLTSPQKGEEQNLIRGEKTGMILNPNQEAIYRRDESKLIKRLTTTPEIVITLPPAELIFDASPVSDVLSTISKRYGVSIVYNEDLLANCLFTGDLTDNSLYEQLDFISRIANARYDLVEGQVIIHSTGCPEIN